MPEATGPDVQYLISQDGQSALQPTGGAVFGSTGQPLRVVAHLRLQRVDVSDDLFGSTDVVGHVVDGLRAAESAGAERRAAASQKRNLSDTTARILPALMSASIHFSTWTRVLRRKNAICKMRTRWIFQTYSITVLILDIDIGSSLHSEHIHF